MLNELLMPYARALLIICAVAAGMELLSDRGGGAPSFRSVCALAVAVGACRLAARLLGLG